MQGKYQVHMRHKISGCHCFVYNCDFRPYCLGDWIVAVKLTAQIHSLCDYPSSAWTMARVLLPFSLLAKGEKVSRR